MPVARSHNNKDDASSRRSLYALYSSAIKGLQSRRRVAPLQNDSAGSTGNATASETASSGVGLMKRFKTSPSYSVSSRSLAAIAAPNVSTLKWYKKNADIYVKAPHFVAGGTLAGTVVVPHHHHDGLERVLLRLVGLETVIHPTSFSEKTYTRQFLDKVVLNYDRQALGKHRKIPFVTQLPLKLAPTYIDKKGFVQYKLESEFHVANGDIVRLERTIHVYPNATARLADVYAPVQEHKEVWRTVNVDIQLARSLWMTGAPIYASIKINNGTEEALKDIRMEILRRQNTFSRETSGLTVPVTSTCDVVASTTTAHAGWWEPLEPHASDTVTLAVQSTASIPESIHYIGTILLTEDIFFQQNQYSIRNLELLDVSYSLRFILSSSTNTETILELPIILVHPISMDPPPGPYAATPREDCRQFLFALFQGSEDPLPSASVSAASTPPSHPATPASQGTLARTTNQVSKNAFTKRQRLSRLARSLAQWLLKQRRPRRSTSGRLLAALPHTQQQQQQQERKARDASTLTPSTVHIRHGKVRSPKQFGRRPGCQGDAGLDIRQKLNVATATEAWQPCQAERWNGQAIDTTARVVWRQPPRSNGIRHAPSEKFELSTGSPSSCRPSIKATDNQGGLPPLPPSTQGHQHKYPRGQGMKRMLASSRYMKNLQTNSLPVTQDGRRLLTLSTLPQHDTAKGEGITM
ncbi:hypothetical protein BCR43DRAFT_514150 [Syncephalastrum racemosum]|uniref:Arrestin C-terminal-like domain-containing protein n=1 Tax=Syncephalastrum racemosum TaxID=13706 RepID=A0A1X2HFT2_SYNRA|nr:hypothetical protein BCR43DRAFT_514150 [Syncephalastrum racemosum]